MSETTRHESDIHALSQKINSASGDWNPAQQAESAYQTDEPLEYFNAKGELVITITVRDTAAGTNIGEHSPDGTSMKYQAYTNSY